MVALVDLLSPAVLSMGDRGEVVFGLVSCATFDRCILRRPKREWILPEGRVEVPERKRGEESIYETAEEEAIPETRKEGEKTDKDPESKPEDFCLASISARMFMSSLFSAAVFRANKDLSPALCSVLTEDARLFFNHFLVFEKKIKAGDVPIALCRGAALSSCPTQPGYDHLIPYVSGGKIGYIFGQIKNHDVHFGPEKIGEVFENMKACAAEIVDPNAPKAHDDPEPDDDDLGAGDYPGASDGLAKAVGKMVLDSSESPFENCIFILINLRQGYPSTLSVQVGETKSIEGSKAKFNEFPKGTEITKDMVGRGIEIVIQGPPLRFLERFGATIRRANRSL